MSWDNMMNWMTGIEGFSSVAAAAGLGALMGLEREVAGKPAGLRTHVFVAAGAALLMVLSRVVLDEFQRLEGSEIVQTDPVRTIQAIIVGISFLGAGTILQQGVQRVEGLTTAASIFLTAAIGIAAALKQHHLAIAVTVSAVAVLLPVGFVERWLQRRMAHRSRRPSDRDRHTDCKDNITMPQRPSA